MYVEQLRELSRQAIKSGNWELADFYLAVAYHIGQLELVVKVAHKISEQRSDDHPLDAMVEAIDEAFSWMIQGDEGDPEQLGAEQEQTK